MKSNNKVVFLVNLGSPESSQWLHMFKYLAKFLSNPRVLNIPAPFRQILGGFIIPLLRSGPSGKLYDNIWQEEGSPLVINSQKQAQNLAEKLPEWQVHWCMNISPNFFPDYLADYLAGSDWNMIDELVIIPMYPQQADSTTAVTTDQLNSVIALDDPNRHKVRVVEDFFDNDAFISYWAQQLNKSLQDEPADLILLSYHSLPLSHLVDKQKQLGRNCNGHCSDCNISEENKLDRVNRSCYKASCYATSQLIQRKLNIPVQVKTVFQSNIGKRWIEPNIIDVVAETKAKNILLAAPSFVIDCLETLEELGMRLNEQVCERGISCRLVPCPNDHNLMMETLVDLVNQSI